jgi:glucodextranase-like protein
MRLAVLVLALVLVIAAPAYAGSPDSNITTPADSSFLVDDGGNTTFTVSGTASFNNIDILCVYGSGDTRVPISSTTYPAYYNIPLQAGSNFTATLPLAPLDYYACRLRAVPHGTTTVDPTAHGPQIGVARRDIFDNPSPYDYDLQLAPFGGFSEFGGVGNCGLPSNFGEDPGNLAYTDRLFDCADALPGPNAGASHLPVFDSRSSVQVDGRDAFFNKFLNTIATTAPPQPVPVLTVDPATGNGTVSAQDDLRSCPVSVAYPPNHANCAAPVGSGVRLDHGAMTVDNGRLAVTRERFVSTDGAPHSVDLWFQQGTALLGSVTYRFPGETSFSTRQAGDQSGVQFPAVPGGPGTMAINQSLTPGGYGVLGWAGAPDTVRFSDDQTFHTHYAFTVPAGGSYTLGFVYGGAFLLSGAEDLVAPGLAQFAPPSVSIAAPANGSGVGVPSVAVSGSASVSFGTPKVTVNGVAVSVAADGGWSAGVPLNPGANTLTATVVDGNGRSATATRSVTYTPGGPPPKARKASLGRVTLGGDGTVTVNVNVGAAGVVSGLETTSVPRSGSAVIQKPRARPRARKITVSKGKRRASRAGTVKLVLKLNKKGRALLRRKHRLPVSIAVTWKPTGGTVVKFKPLHRTLKPHKARKHR